VSLISRLIVLTCAAALITGCGSGGGTSSSTGSSGNTGGNSGGGSVSAPAVVTATGGGTATGVDIAVVAPASSTSPNAQVIGAAATSASSLSLTNTEARVSKAAGTQVVALCGTGLLAAMKVGVGDAPGVSNSDFTITNITGVTCSGSGSGSTSTPGLQFDITVASGALLGNRTVFLQSTNNDVTTFTGGLEVVQ
jgi:hypothetical protein